MAKINPPRIRTKEAVLKFAKKDNRKILWRDAEGKWHAARDKNNLPNWAVEWEEVK